VTDLLAWLREQVDTDERLALAAAEVKPFYTISTADGEPATKGPYAGPLVHHIANHDPARALREVAAKRAILDDYDVAAVSVAAAVDTPLAGATRLQLRIRSEAVRAIAAIYVDRPGWREEWTA
jgi:hypothetical protein